MANKDIFAPPTKEELEQTKMFAPPSKEELDSLKESGPSLKETLKKGAKVTAETLEDLGISAADAAALGLGPRVYAAGRAVLSDKSFGEEYSKGLQEAQQFVKEHQERSPIASTVGGLAGALVPGGLMAKGIKGAAEVVGLSRLPMMQKLAQAGITGATTAGAIEAGVPAAIAGGVEGGIAGGARAPEGQVIEGAKEGAKIGTLVGGGIGGAAGALGGATKGVSKALDEALVKRDTDWKRSQQTAEAFRMGTKGEPLPSAGKLTGLAGEGPGEIQKTSESLADKFFQGYDTMRKKISGSVDKATEEGVTYSKDEIGSLYSNLKNADFTGKDTVLNKFNIKSPDAALLQPGTPEVTPRDLFNLKVTLNKDLKTLRNAQTPNVGEIGKLESAAKQADELLSKVEGYKQATDEFRNFAEKTTDVAVNRGETGAAQTILTTSLDDADLTKNLRDYFRKAMYSSEQAGKSSLESKRKYANLLNELQEYEKTNPGKLKSLGMDPKEIAEEVHGTAKKIGILGLEEGVSGRSSTIPGSVFELLELPQWANVAGRGARGVSKAGAFLGGQQNYGQRLQKLIEMGAPESQIQEIKDAMSQQNAAKVNALTNTILQQMGKKSSQEQPE